MTSLFHCLDISLFLEVGACFCVYFFPLSLGISSGFSAVAIPQLRQPDDFGLSEEQASWFGE